MKTLFSYFQQFSLTKVQKTRLQAAFVTNNQILIAKTIKMRPPPPPPLISLLDFMILSPPPRLLRPLVYSGPKSNIF